MPTSNPAPIIAAAIRRLSCGGQQPGGDPGLEVVAQLLGAAPTDGSSNIARIVPALRRSRSSVSGSSARNRK